MVNKLADFFKHPLLYIILAAFLARLYFLVYHGIAWWDSSVYIGLGKYIFSGGAVGVNEAFRPILWPLILGFVWKIGINPLIFGMVFDLILNLASIYLVYIIAKKIINRKAAMFAAILMAISPALVFYSSKALTENLAIVLILLSVYFMIEKKYVHAGLFAGISVLARYPNGLMLPSLILFVLIFGRGGWKFKLKDSFRIAEGFVIPIFALLLYNLISFGNVFYQFTEAQKAIAQAGAFFPEPWFYYFSAIMAECFLSVLFFYSKYLAWKEKNRNIWLMGIIFLVFFIYYSTVDRKEIRYLMVVLPMLYIPVAYALENLYYKRLFGKHVAKYVIISLVVLFAVSSFFAAKSLQDQFYRPETGDVMNNFYNSAALVGKDVISSSPVPAAYMDLKLTLMEPEVFYKYVNMSSNYYLFYTCDFFCSDASCTENRKAFLNIIKNKRTLVYGKKEENGCEYLIYENS